MKKLALVLAIALSSCATQTAAPDSPELAAFKQRAEGITIVRDDWGVPHIYGKTDADVVFGLMYAQAEDDFNRVETNFINSQGRLAEAEGESAIYRDLRMKLFIDPADMQAKYNESPEWLKALMDAWADGLNFYLATHPDDFIPSDATTAFHNRAPSRCIASPCRRARADTSRTVSTG